MSVENRPLLGSLLFIGAAQIVLVMTVAEALYPGYNMATNYISDLGVGSTALLFNASAVVFGVMLLLGAVFGRRTLGTLLTITVALSGAAVVGVGLFPETTGALHLISAIVAFGLGAVSAILSYRVTRRPLSYFSVVLGVIALVALVLFVAHYDPGIGRGGIERVLAYSVLLWVLGFGGAMIGSK
jgi:hypothetical membrane protein